MNTKHETERQAHKREAAEEEAAERKREDREAAAAQAKQAKHAALGKEADTIDADTKAKLEGFMPSINEPPRPPDVPPAEPLTAAFLDPAQAEIGGPDLTMSVIGTGFTAAAVITFNGGDEATTRVSSTELTTIVKPSTATVAGVYPVTVKQDGQETEPLGFTFSEPVITRSTSGRR